MPDAGWRSRCRSAFEEPDAGSPAVAAGRTTMSRLITSTRERGCNRDRRRLSRASGPGRCAGAAMRSPRSSSTAPTRARARPTTRSWSAPAGPKRSAIASPRSCARAALARRPARRGPTRPAVRDRRRDRDFSCSPVGPGRLHRLPDPGHQAGRSANASSRRTRARLRRSENAVSRMRARCYAARDRRGTAD